MLELLPTTSHTSRDLHTIIKLVLIQISKFIFRTTFKIDRDKIKNI